MWWILIPIIGYIIFKNQIEKNFKKIKKWIESNKDKLKEYEKIPAIKKAYDELVAEIKKAGLDKRWTIFEILAVLSKAATLIELIKKYEGGK